MYNTIIDALEAILKTITEIKAVYDTEVAVTTNYPYAVIVPSGRSSSYSTMGTGGQNKREYTFVIRVYGNMQDTATNTQKVIRTIADKIDIALEKNNNIGLSGAIAYSMLSDGAFRFSGGDAPIYMYEVTYRAVAHVTRT